MVGGRRAGQGWVDFFLLISILFHQCNNENIYQQFYYYLRFIFYTLILILHFSKNYTLAARNVSSPTVFDLDG